MKTNHFKLLLGLALLLMPISFKAAQASDSQPNIILILADDLGYGDIQALNPERGKIRTPHLDQLASQGMRFSEAHSGAAVCTPTRYGLLTGRYAWRSRLQKGVLDGYVQPLIDADRLTLPGMLKQHGYRSACIGKWHLGYTIQGADKKGGGAKEKLEGAPFGAITQDGPITRGFDLFYGFHHARMIKSIFENDRVTQIVEPIDVLPQLAQRASDFVQEQAAAKQPFFLYLPLSSPHTPILPTKPWQGKSELGSYGDFVMQTDEVVGQVLDAVERARITDHTLVFFTSDNGCSPAAKTTELEKLGHFASEQRRGYKADIWDGGHRVPLLVRWPNQVKAGSQCDHLVCLTDVIATCAEIVGVALPENAGEDSVSILPKLKEMPSASPDRGIVHHSIQGKFAIREGQWKLCLCAGSGGWTKGGDDAPLQLYNMSSDPGEASNVASGNAEVVQRLTRLMEKYVTDGRSTPGAKQKNDVQVSIH